MKTMVAPEASSFESSACSGAVSSLGRRTYTHKHARTQNTDGRARAKKSKQKTRTRMRGQTHDMKKVRWGVRACVWAGGLEWVEGQSTSK